MRTQTGSLVLAVALVTTRAWAVTDHLQCYKITNVNLKGLKGLVDLNAPSIGVAAGCKLTKAKLYCVPASKAVQVGTLFDGSLPVTTLPYVGPPAETARICYTVRCPKLVGFGPDQTVTDQFGVHQLTRLTTGMLCTPAGTGGGYCGDGTLGGGEQCEGGNLGGATCASLGFTGGGTLACDASCRFDASTCACAIAGAGPAFPATGQTTCWNATGSVIPCAGTGHDGDHQAGLPLSYVDNGDGTITDSNTGLQWEKLSDDGSLHDKDATYTWATAFTGKVAALNAASFAGHTDWRVPNVRELQSILNYETNAPRVSPDFKTSCAPTCTVLTCSCTLLGYYWSSTSDRNSPTSAWGVDFIFGDVIAGSKPASEAVRAVRGGS